MMGRHHCRVLRGLPGVELVAVADAEGDPHGAAPGLPLRRGRRRPGRARPRPRCRGGAHRPARGGRVRARSGAGARPRREAARCRPRRRRAGSPTPSPPPALVGCVGHIERFNPALQQLRRRLEAGELGQVYQVTTRRQGPFPARIADVGVVKDLATHDIDRSPRSPGQPFASVSARLAYKQRSPARGPRHARSVRSPTGRPCHHLGQLAVAVQGAHHSWSPASAARSSRHAHL